MHILHSVDVGSCSAEVSTSGAPSHTALIVQVHGSLNIQTCQQNCQDQRWQVVHCPFSSPVLPTRRHTSAVAAAHWNLHNLSLNNGADNVAFYSIAASTSVTSQGNGDHSLVRLAGLLHKDTVWDEVVNSNLEGSLYRALLRQLLGRPSPGRGQVWAGSI